MNYFLDTNVLLRYFTNDNKKLSPKAAKIIDQVAARKITVSITTLVLHEVAYVMESVYKVDRKDIFEKLSGLVGFPNLRILDLDKARVFIALNDFGSTKVDFADCIYKQVALEHKLKIVSFDKDISKLKIKRFETV